MVVTISVMEHRLRVAIYEDPDRTGLEADEHRWIARSLTHDVFGESTTREGALHNLLAATLLEVKAAVAEKRAPFEGLPRASRSFVAWWAEETAQPLALPSDLDSLLPGPWLIDAMVRQDESRLR